MTRTTVKNRTRRALVRVQLLVACALAWGASSSTRSAWTAPLGPEFRINTTVADSQVTSTPSSHTRAVAGNGSAYVVVWQSRLQDGDGYGVFAQRYDASGTPLGSEFVVNTTSSGDQRLASVAMDTGGSFVIVWEGNGAGDTDGVFARLFDATGSALGPEFRVNQTTLGVQREASVTMDNGGEFVVVWSGSGPGDASGIFSRIYTASGTPRIDEQIVNTDALGVQSSPRVAIDSNGDHVVVWEGPGAAGDLDIFFQRFDGNGVPRGVATRANTTTSEDQRRAAVARSTNGRFVVAWESDTDPSAAVDLDVFAQAFNDDGSPSGSEFRVNSVTAGDQIEPCVDAESSGDFVVVWTSDEDVSAGIDWDVRLHRYSRDGVPVGNNVIVPTTAAGSQRGASIAIVDLDEFLVVWHGRGATDDEGVFGRLFGTGEAADVGVSLSVDDPAPAVGESINLFVTLTNNGPGIASGIAVTDVLPSGLIYVSHFASQGDYDPVSGLWNVPSMAVSTSDALRITVQPDSASAGLTLTNVATVTAIDQIDVVTDNDTASVDIFPQIGHIGVRVEPQATGRVLPGGAARPVLHLRLVNADAVYDTLRALTLTNATSGAATQAQQDASWQPLSLHVDGVPDAVGVGTFVGGRATFADVSVVIAPHDSLSLTVWSGASLVARDSDRLDLLLQAPTDVSFSGSIAVSPVWPLDPPGGFDVDGMSSAQILVRDVPARNIFAGSTRNLAFDFVVPANGYEPDVLEKLNIVNFGSAPDDEFTALEAWADDGDGSFDPARDAPLGELAFTGNRWELTALARPVDTSGLRLFVSVDLSGDATVGGTLRLGLADDTDVALGMASDNDGPLDAPVTNRFELSISTNDRVTVNAAALGSGTTRPGSSEVGLLQLAATNSYASNRRLVELTLSNTTTSPNGGSGSQLDAELERVQLHVDANGNGSFDGAAVDPVLATSFFTQGRASFGPFSWDIPAGATRHLFVSGDVALREAADGDVLGVQVVDPLDLVFETPTAITASWPLDSAARWSIDGMVVAQITNHGAPGLTLGPGDGPVLALDVTVPANGYADDVLNGVTLRNLGSASGPDVADMQLWQDGGDGTFTPGGGDDTELAPLVLVGSSWKSPQLSANVGAQGLRLFVGATVGTSPGDSTSLQLTLPMGGLQMQSGNDGPADGAIINPQALILSAAPLLSSLSMSPARVTVGQSFTVTMMARNVGTETVLDVMPSALSAVGDANAGLLLGPTPASMDLTPSSATSTFDWTYQATAVGRMQLHGNVQGTEDASGLLRRSLLSFSNEIEVLLPADSLLVQPVGTMPFSVLRGEANVVPLSLTLTNNGGASTAEVALTRLRLRIEDGAGAGLVPADVLSRIALSEGNVTYVESSNLPSSGSEMLLTLDSPVLITPNDPVTISMRCDVSPTTQQSEFRVVIDSATWLDARDAVSGAPVDVGLRQGNFPLVSGTGEIRAAPTQLRIEANPTSVLRASHGQTDVLLLDVALQNPGVADLTSDVLVSAFECSVMDAAGQPLSDPSRFFSSVRVKSGTQILEEHAVLASQGDALSLTLSLPMTVAVNSTTPLTILGDIRDNAPLGDVFVRLGVPATLDARDANTNAAVPVHYVEAPIDGARITLEAAATTLAVRGTPRLPTAIGIGSVDVEALVADLRHPGTTGVGRLEVRALRVACRDESRRALSADVYVDQIRVLAGALELARVTQIPVTSTVDIPITPVVLEPGESASIHVALDFEATAPNAFFELAVPSFTAVDVNLGTPLAIAPEDGDGLPLVSGLTFLESPATQLVVGLESRMPAVLVGDGAPVTMARLALTNTASGRSGSITIDHLVVRGADRAHTPAHLGRAVSRVMVYRGGQLWAASDSLSADSLSVSLWPNAPLVVAAGETILLDVLASVQSAPGLDGLRIGVQSEDIGVVQPSSAVLLVRVESEAGRTFPLWSDAGSFSVASLRESFANFPNPFAAGRESTTFAFYLAEPAFVTLRMLSPRGELVATLAHKRRHEPGLHQSVLWGGRNERQRVVTNGVYVAELIVQYAGGRSERLLRKVAIVR